MIFAVIWNTSAICRRRNLQFFQNYSKINEKDLKKLLTPTEWQSIMGSIDTDTKYALTYPDLIKLHAEGDPTERRVLDLETDSLGNFNVVLDPSPSLIAHDFLVLSTNTNGSVVVPHDHVNTVNCYYRSTNAALSLCNGIRGILHSTGNLSYLIHPLPERLHHNATAVPHVITQKRIMSLPTYRHYTHSLGKDSLSSHESSQKDSLNSEDINHSSYCASSPAANRNKASIKVPSVFNHFLRRENVKRRKNGNRNEILELYRNALLGQHKNELLVQYKNGVVDQHKNGTLHQQKDEMLEGNNISDSGEKQSETKNLVRHKRDVGFPEESPVFVETAVFVDRDLFDHMKTNFPINTERELIRFVLAMINAVQLLYHDPSLGRPVNFLLKRLEILKDETPGLSRPPDIDRYLSNFCNWQRTKNPAGDREPQHWDHALILTGLDLYVRGKHGKISSQVVGLAPVAGMCTSTSSCTVNEGRHFESVYVVAHEIGHNLGMRHDGPLADNDCDPSSYIMSPTLGSGKITWSSCSRIYLQKFLDTPQSRCLLDHSSSAGQLDHGAEGALPGERFDANAQCMLKYGRGSRHSSQQPLDDVCRDLHCERERYTWTSHPALEGTMCGFNLWCRSGRCVRKGSSSHLANTAAFGALQTSARLETVNGGWSKWRGTVDCASGCLYGEEGRLRAGSTGIMMATRMCTNPRPQGGGSKCDGIDKKFQACSAQQCLNVPRLTIREFADQICTRAKEVDKVLTGVGLQKISSDPEEACIVWCQKRNGGTKSRGWTFPDGTVCQTRRNTYRQSYCINGRCEEFSCDPYDEFQHSQMAELCPSAEHEDNDVSVLYQSGASSNSLRRRESGGGGVAPSSSGATWTSASGCHYNCVTPGIGLRLVVGGKSQSLGKPTRSSIQTCKPDQYGCGRIKSPFQHASMVCTKYKERVRRLSGLGMQISPALEDPDRPCRVACQDENISHRFYLVNGEDGWFPFGTDCARGLSDKKAFCISGKCLEFGSDDTPLSQSEFTLPLLSRTRRSLQHNNTKVTAILHQHELDEIISKLNQTIRGYIFPSQFEIDLNNPIQVNMDMDPENTPHHYYKSNNNYNDNDDHYNYT